MTKKPQPRTLGARLAELRLAQGLTVYQLAQRSGQQNSTIARIESGQAKDPRISTLAALAAALGVSVAEFVQ